MHPEKALKELALEVSILLRKDRSTVLNEYIEKKTEQVSRKSQFAKRIRNLEQIAEFSPAMPNEILERVNAIADVRNVIAHGNLQNNIVLDERLNVILRPHNGILHVGITVDYTFLGRVMVFIYRGIGQKLAGRKLHETENTFLDLIYNTEPF